jgi:hypothetical protein
MASVSNYHSQSQLGLNRQLGRQDHKPEKHGEHMAQRPSSLVRNSRGMALESLESIGGARHPVFRAYRDILTTLSLVFLIQAFWI